jgi:hypothetical protein
MASFGERMLGAARLDRAIYEEVEHDTTATRQALGVVVLTALATGLGTGAGLRGLVVGTVASVVGWAVWAGLVYWIGTQVLGEPETRADWGEVARTVGFAHSPALLRVAGVIPALGHLAFLVTSIWLLVTTVVAVRQALDYRSWPRAIGVCVVGWALQAIAFTFLLRALRPV